MKEIDLSLLGADELFVQPNATHVGILFLITVHSTAYCLAYCHTPYQHVVQLQGSSRLHQPHGISRGKGSEFCWLAVFIRS